MDIEIKIGRSVEGSNTILVPATFKRVSRVHATIHWHDGIVTIEDNGSTNGTFVNGQRITRAILTENDTVWLGGTGVDEYCYQLDLRRIFASFPSTIPVQKANPVQEVNYVRNVNSFHNVNSVQEAGCDTQRTDYTREFARVKQAYIDYHAGMSKLSKKANTRMQLPRVLLSLIPAALGVVIMIISTDMTVRIVAMSAGSVLSGLIGVLTMGKSSSNKEKMAEAVLDLQLKYQKLYKCPKCGKEFNLDLHWKKLEAEGKCPYGCGARYV